MNKNIHFVSKLEIETYGFGIQLKTRYPYV